MSSFIFSKKLPIQIKSRHWMLIVGSILAIVIFATPQSTNAQLSGSLFKPGRIIDDAVFYNPDTMTASQIQQFLNAKVPSCDTNGTMPYGGTTRANYGTSKGYPPPYTCLRHYSQTIPTVVNGGSDLCKGSIAGGLKSAAQIIWDVSQACDINPKVLIVLLEKEQSLITDDWPWSIQYRSATGYGCPDTAPCDAEYYGFFNQVYNAAKAFQRYTANPTSYNYEAGTTNTILWHPNAACGSSSVNIVNQATANLYIYTPYRPNQAALNNLYGTGDGCSSYGNRNFWRIFNDWFGNTLATTPYNWMISSQEIYSNTSRTESFNTSNTAAPGQKLYVRVKARNSGTSTWSKSNLRMATSNPNSRSSVFHDNSWLSGTRTTTFTEASVAPGQTGTFDFVLEAPLNPGSYKERFNLVAEGITWLNNPGLAYNINVVEAVSPLILSSTGLNPGEALLKGNNLLSPDSQSILRLERNGDLTLRTNFEVVWRSNTSDSGAERLVMQGDGNLVLYKNNNQVVWHTGTNNNSGARLQLQTDGNVVIYSPAEDALWSTSSLHNPDLLSFTNQRLNPGNILFKGQRLETADRKYKLILHGDGNLVLYSPNRAIWSTSTSGSGVERLAMQGDGNLVLYKSNSQVAWRSGTNGKGPSFLALQPDGNVVLYKIGAGATWHTKTHNVQ